MLLTLTAVSIFTGGRNTSDQRGAEDLSREGFNPWDYDRYSWWVGGLRQGQLKAGVKDGGLKLPTHFTPGTGSGNSREQPQDSGWCFHPLTQSPLSLLSDRTLACRCSTTCRQTLSFWLVGWRCWRLSSGQVTLRHPHPQLCWPSAVSHTDIPDTKTRNLEIENGWMLI